MTLPPIIRIFFAIELPETIKQKIGDYISALKKKSKPHVIRWTRNDNLHITLQFIGEANRFDLDKICNSVQSRIKNIHSPMQISVGDLQLFPTPFRPRVIVLDILPQEALSSLAHSIGEGVEAAGYAIEKRPFRAHMTLGRIKQPKNLDLSYLGQTPKVVCEEIFLQEFVLYRSEPGAEGSTYTVLERLKLSNSP